MAKMPVTTLLLDKHSVCPGAACEPLAQGEQTEAPLFWLNESAGHSVQAVEPELALCDPAGHEAHER